MPLSLTTHAHHVMHDHDQPSMRPPSEAACQAGGRWTQRCVQASRVMRISLQSTNMATTLTRAFEGGSPRGSSIAGRKRRGKRRERQSGSTKALLWLLMSENGTVHAAIIEVHGLSGVAASLDVEVWWRRSG